MDTINCPKPRLADFVPRPVFTRINASAFFPMLIFRKAHGAVEFKFPKSRIQCHTGLEFLKVYKRFCNSIPYGLMAA